MTEFKRKEKALWEYSCAFHCERMLFVEREKINAGSNDWFEADKVWRAAREKRVAIGDTLLDLGVVVRDDLKKEEREVRDEVRDYHIDSTPSMRIR